MFCALCSAAVLIFFVLSFVAWIRKYQYWEGQGVPVVAPEFPFGNFWSAFTMKEPMFEVVAKAYDRFQDAALVGMYAPTQPILLVRDPDLAKQVLVDNFYDFVDNGFELNPSIDPLLGYNPFATTEKTWKVVRSIHTPIYTNSKVKVAMKEIISSARNLINHIQKERNDVINFSEVAKCFLADAVSKSAYGVDLEVWTDPDPLVKHLITWGVTSSALEFNFSALFSVLLPWANFLARCRSISSKSYEFMMQIYRTAVPMRRKGSVRNDAIQHLVEYEQKLKAKGSKGFSDPEWAAHLMVFFLDGTETAGLALSYSVFLISQHPDIQKRMREEIREKGITLDNMDFESIRSLAYMEMVLQECLRKLPPLPVLSRKATKDTTLGPVRVPKGMKVIVPVMKLQNDPKYYERSEDFDPDRFSSEKRSGLRKGTYFPFGDGPRICVGMNYAKTSIKVALAALLLEFSWTTGPSHGANLEIEEKSTFFLVPKNSLIEVKFHPLQRS